jgi:uncharacterized membrane protein YbaN (DUF454 family)
MSAADQHIQAAKVAADTVSAAAIVGVFVQVLPPIAALMAILWYAVQIYESHTVQSWLHKHRVVKRYRQRRKRRPVRHEPIDTFT